MALREEGIVPVGKRHAYPKSQDRVDIGLWGGIDTACGGRSARHVEGGETARLETGRVKEPRNSRIKPLRRGIHILWLLRMLYHIPVGRRGTMGGLDGPGLFHLVTYVKEFLGNLSVRWCHSQAFPSQRENPLTGMTNVRCLKVPFKFQKPL